MFSCEVYFSILMQRSVYFKCVIYLRESFTNNIHCFIFYFYRFCQNVNHCVTYQLIIYLYTTINSCQSCLFELGKQTNILGIIFTVCRLKIHTTKIGIKITHRQQAIDKTVICLPEGKKYTRKIKINDMTDVIIQRKIFSLLYFHHSRV